MLRYISLFVRWVASVRKKYSTWCISLPEKMDMYGGSVNLCIGKEQHLV